MPSCSIRVTGLAYAFADAPAAVFSSADLHLTTGWTGLVGGNGVGKSTLLRLLAGELSPTEGQIHYDPPDPAVRLCAQTVDELPSGATSLGASGAGRRWMGRLGLTDDQPWRWPTLSPGERKRWQVAVALAADPDVLLLDEPTNHLDADTRDLLVAALARFRGVGVVVSHDRDLLDALTTGTVRVHGGAARQWSGGYETARREWEAEQRGRVAARDAAQHALRQQARRLHEARRERESAEARRSARRRMRNANDSDARAIGAATRAAWAEDRLGRTVGVTRRATERAAEALDGIEVDKALGRSVFVDYQRAPVPWLLTLDAPVLRAGEPAAPDEASPPLLRDVHLALGRGDRVHLAGPNGAGKSTLIAAMLAASRLPPDRLLHLPQEVTAADAAAALQEIRALPADARGRVLSLVAALGVDPERLLASAQPSPGEARKLLIARGLGRHAWGLVLDEPTNHLDLPAVERLEAALAAFPGALLLVSHDERFARACTSARWRIEGGRVTTSD